MVVWIIGMSGAGKTAIGQRVYESLKEEHQNLVLLDGDHFRAIVGNDVGHSVEDRKVNADRMSNLCKFLDDQGIHVICCILSIFPESREWNRTNYSHYYEVFVDVDFEELVQRDSKELYKKALAGELENVVGVDIEFNPPENPDVIIKNNGDRAVEEIAAELANTLKPLLD